MPPCDLSATPLERTDVSDGMARYTEEDLQRVGMELLTACGAPEEEAELVVHHLVEASLMGIDSHGVVRYVMYVEECLQKRLRPGAPVTIERETPSLIVVDGGNNFGQVGAYRMAKEVERKVANTGIAFAVSRRCHHVGRLGAYPQKLAEAGLFAFAVANSHAAGHFVVPWGGREGRLATNPLAWAAPTSGHPVLLDMSTSMMPEGKVRTALHAGTQVQTGAIIDAHGEPTTDPASFYGPPRGAILPFGGDLGFRGFGLGLLVEVLGSTIAGEELTESFRYVNGLGLLAIDAAGLCGDKARFSGLVDDLASYVTDTPPAPGYDEVIMPGEREFRLLHERRQTGIPLADESVRQIIDVGERVGVRVELSPQA